jgi:hypothetical protein
METFSTNGEAMDINSVKLLAIDCFCYTYKFQSKLKIFFCSTLSEFENFLLCERILINVTTGQNETSS